MRFANIRPSFSTDLLQELPAPIIQRLVFFVLESKTNNKMKGMGKLKFSPNTFCESAYVYCCIVLGFW